MSISLPSQEMTRLNQFQAEGFLQTPPLWYKEQFEIEQFDFPEIDLTNFSMKAIPQKIRLGHQMEYVFKQLVIHSNRYEILLHNLPVKDGNRTIGEIDFILKDLQTSKLIHVELTYKFYIIDPKITEPIHRLVGPNRRDTFFAKMEKIKKHQFPLLHSKFGIQALEKIDLNHEEIVHKTCFKAQLFSPYQSKKCNVKPLNNDCIIGYWLRFDDFKAVSFKSFQFHIPAKSEWVTEPHDNVQWAPHSETILHINLRILKGNAPMVWLRISEVKFEKIFVVI